MASILDRGPNQYQVVIRRKNHPTQTKTFETNRSPLHRGICITFYSRTEFVGQ